MKNLNMRSITAWATLLLISSCTQMCGKTRGDLRPQEVVEGYLDIALNMTDVAQKEQLLAYTTDNLKEAIENSSEDTIQQAYVDRKYEIKSYSVVERRDRTPRETEITFQLTYLDLGTEGVAPESAPEVTTENTVSVVKKNSIWYIKDVLGNKTSIDFPVSELSKITPETK